MENESEKKNPYVLSLSERTFPKGIPQEQRAWLEKTLGIQAEGVKMGIRPQNLRGLPEYAQSKWRSQVWNPYRKSQPKEDQLAGNQFSEGGERHTRPQLGVGTPEPGYLINGRRVIKKF